MLELIKSKLIAEKPITDYDCEEKPLQTKDYFKKLLKSKYSKPNTGKLLEDLNTNKFEQQKPIKPEFAIHDVLYNHHMFNKDAKKLSNKTRWKSRLQKQKNAVKEIKTQTLEDEFLEDKFKELGQMFYMMYEIVAPFLVKDDMTDKHDSKFKIKGKGSKRKMDTKNLDNASIMSNSKGESPKHTKHFKKNRTSTHSPKFVTSLKKSRSALGKAKSSHSKAKVRNSKHTKDLNKNHTSKLSVDNASIKSKFSTSSEKSHTSFDKAKSAYKTEKDEETELQAHDLEGWEEPKQISPTESTAIRNLDAISENQEDCCCPKDTKTDKSRAPKLFKKLPATATKLENSETEVQAHDLEEPKPISPSESVTSKERRETQEFSPSESISMKEWEEVQQLSPSGSSKSVQTSIASKELKSTTKKTPQLCACIDCNLCNNYCASYKEDTASIPVFKPKNLNPRSANQNRSNGCCGFWKCCFSKKQPNKKVSTSPDSPSNRNLAKKQPKKKVSMSSACMGNRNVAKKQPNERAFILSGSPPESEQPNKKVSILSDTPSKSEQPNKKASTTGGCCGCCNSRNRKVTKKQPNERASTLSGSPPESEQPNKKVSILSDTPSKSEQPNKKASTTGGCCGCCNSRNRKVTKKQPNERASILSGSPPESDKPNKKVSTPGGCCACCNSGNRKVANKQPNENASTSGGCCGWCKPKRNKPSCPICENKVILYIDGNKITLGNMGNTAELPVRNNTTSVNSNTKNNSENLDFPPINESSNYEAYPALEQETDTETTEFTPILDILAAFKKLHSNSFKITIAALDLEDNDSNSDRQQNVCGDPSCVLAPRNPTATTRKASYQVFLQSKSQYSKANVESDDITSASRAEVFSNDVSFINTSSSTTTSISETKKPSIADDEAQTYELLEYTRNAEEGKAKINSRVEKRTTAVNTLFAISMNVKCQTEASTRSKLSLPSLTSQKIISQKYLTHFENHKLTPNASFVSIESVLNSDQYTTYEAPLVPEIKLSTSRILFDTQSTTLTSSETVNKTLSECFNKFMSDIQKLEKVLNSQQLRLKNHQKDTLVEDNPHWALPKCDKKLLVYTKLSKTTKDDTLLMDHNKLVTQTLPCIEEDSSVSNLITEILYQHLYSKQSPTSSSESLSFIPNMIHKKNSGNGEGLQRNIASMTELLSSYLSSILIFPDSSQINVAQKQKAAEHYPARTFNLPQPLSMGFTSPNKHTEQIEEEIMRIIDLESEETLELSSDMESQSSELPNTYNVALSEESKEEFSCSTKMGSSCFLLNDKKSVKSFFNSSLNSRCYELTRTKNTINFLDRSKVPMESTCGFASSKFFNDNFADYDSNNEDDDDPEWYSQEFPSLVTVNNSSQYQQPKILNPDCYENEEVGDYTQATKSTISIINVLPEVKSVSVAKNQKTHSTTFKLSLEFPPQSKLQKKIEKLNNKQDEQARLKKPQFKDLGAETFFKCPNVTPRTHNPSDFFSTRRVNEETETFAHSSTNCSQQAVCSELYLVTKRARTSPTEPKLQSKRRKRTTERDFRLFLGD